MSFHLDQGKSVSIALYYCIRVCHYIRGCAKSLKIICSRTFSHSFGPKDIPKWKIFNIFSNLLSGQAGWSFTLSLLYSDFGPITFHSKNPWTSLTNHLIFSGGTIGASWTSQKKFGVWGYHLPWGLGPPNEAYGGVPGTIVCGSPRPKIFCGKSRKSQ